MARNICCQRYAQALAFAAIAYFLATKTSKAMGMEEDSLPQLPKGTSYFAGPDPAGACCLRSGSGISCIDGLAQSQCESTGSAPPSLTNPVFYPFMTCAEMGGASGCPDPVNDDTVTAASVCQLQSPNPNLGVCSLSAGRPDILEVCNLIANDCPNPLAACIPLSPGVDAYRCQFETDNRLATRDGPGTLGTQCDTAGVDAFQSDIWFMYAAPCSGFMTIHNCGLGEDDVDTMLQVFSTDTPACVSAPIANNDDSLVCSDDHCGSPQGGSALRVRVDEGDCFTIRLGGRSLLGTDYDAAQGRSELDIGVVCSAANAPAAATSPFDWQKNRYLPFVPSNGSNAVAYEVVKTTVPGGSCWVGAPDALGNCRCVSTPVFRVWDEPVLYVGDCEIVPAASYELRASIDGVSFSSALLLNTVPIPALNGKLWGDVAGFNNGIEWTPPNQFANIQDILAILAYISNSAIKPEFHRANLQAISSTDPCLNIFVNTADVLGAVQAVAGSAFPFTLDPSMCPVCP